MTSSAPPLTTAMTPPRPQASTGKHLTAGLFSGLASAIVLQPADLLKTRLQQAPPQTSLVTLVRSLPVLHLWRGTLPSAIRTGVGSALYFTSLNAVRTGVARWQGLRHGHRAGEHSSALVKLPPVANLLTGGFTRASVGFVMMPITVIKVRFESDVFAYRGLADATRDIYRSLGVRGFFAGFGATAIRDAPYAGLYVLFYEMCKGGMSRWTHAAGNGKGISEGKAWVINTSAGALSGAMATAITNPFDTIKTRIQIFPGKYRNMWVAGWRICTEEGVRRLFDGLGLRIARKAISSGVVWGAYEWAVSRTWSSKV